MHLALYFAFWISLVMNQDLTLSVTVTHVKIGRGSLYASIWENEETFFKKPFLSDSIKADHDSLHFQFRLKPGEYAVSVFQDINGNQKLDQGLFGIPKEPIGFGNNFRPKFSAPAFPDCSFRIMENMKMIIELH